MKFFIQKRLRESLNVNQFRVPKNVQLNEKELEHLKNVNWSDLTIDDLGGNGNVAHLRIGFPFETNASDGIVVDVQVLHDYIYQLHLHLTDNLQRLGLGGKIIKAVAVDLGHIYAGNGRILNDNVNKLLESFKNDPDLIYLKNDIGTLIISKDNPDKNELIEFMR